MTENVNTPGPERNPSGASSGLLKFLTMPRPTARGVLSFGLVAIPVEIHTAIHEANVSFNLFHEKCGSRIRNRNLCPVCNVVVERTDLVRGYELNKGKYVQVTEAELDALEAEANSNIELKEFIPIAKVDPVYFEDAHYLAPDEGGDKAYRLLADAMEKSGRVALAEMVSHGKEKLVLIRPLKGGLVLQTMFYANEIRDFNEIPKGEASGLTAAEFELANGLVEKLSSENFEPEAYEDEYQNRVRAMLDSKVKGQEITVPPKAPPRGHVIDLMAALKESMKTVQRGKKSTEQRKRQKA
jgi:DNA end-binding protein Ku